MANVLAFVEQKDGQLGSAAREAVGVAATLAVGEHESLVEYNPEGYAEAVAAKIREGGYGAVVFSATGVGKDLAPRVAAMLDVPLATDVTAVDASSGSVTVTRPVFSGKAFATLTFDASPAMLSIRPNVFQPSERQAAGTVETFAPDVDPSSWRVRVVERKGIEHSIELVRRLPRPARAASWTALTQSGCRSVASFQPSGMLLKNPILSFPVSLSTSS